MQIKHKILYGLFSTESGVQKKRLEWNDIVEQLNALGPPSKNVDGWKKCWSDMRKITKEKAQKIRQHQERTGGGPASKIKLSVNDEIIISIVGECGIIGLPGIEGGIPQTYSGISMILIN